jgi:hypothetical protein
MAFGSHRAGVLAMAMTVVGAGAIASGACGLSALGTGDTDADGGGATDTANAPTSDGSSSADGGSGGFEGGTANLDAGPCDGGRCTCPPITGLVAYHPFDGDLKDHSGNGHDVTASNVAVAPGKLGSACKLNGTSSLMHVGGTLMLKTARTFCAWVSPESATGLGQPVFVGGKTGTGDMFAIQSSTPMGSCTGAPANHLFVDHWGTACGASSSVAAPTGAWSFVCFAFDGGNNTVHFANGATQTVSTPSYPYDLATLTIGSNTIGGSTTQQAFKGVVDEVSIWDHALTASEMSQLYAAGDGCPVR